MFETISFLEHQMSHSSGFYGLSNDKLLLFEVLVVK